MLNYIQPSPNLVRADYDWEVVPICLICWKKQHPGQTVPNLSLEPSYIPGHVIGRPCYNCVEKNVAATYVYRSFPNRQ